MNKILIVILILFFLSCSTKEEIKYCSPVKSVELLINKPKPKFSKYEIGYYDIYKTDENFVYLGYWNLNYLLKREIKPLYRTNKTDFNKIYRKIPKITKIEIIDSIHSLCSNKYENLINDTINLHHDLTKIELTKKKTVDYYNFLCTGLIEFIYYRNDKCNKNPKLNVKYNDTYGEYTISSISYNGNKCDSVKKSYIVKKIKYKLIINKERTITLFKEIK